MALFVSHATAVGGAEIVLQRYLADRTSEHEVLLLSEGPAAAFFESAGVLTTVVPVLDAERKTTRDLSAAEAIRASGRIAIRAPELIRAIRRSSHAVVVTNSMKAHAVVPVLARAASREVGIRLHDIVAPGTASGTAREILRMSSRLATSTAAISRATADAARAAGARRVTFFYNGISLPDDRRRSQSSTLRLLVVSQLARWKGVHHVLESVALALQLQVELQLDVVGDAIFSDPGYRDALHQQAKSLGLADVVRWHGFQPDPSPFYRAADVFVHLPEAAEPLGYALMEAEAHGVPVIAHGIGGIDEIVSDGETGFLVRASDHAQVAKRIAELQDRELRSKLGAAGRSLMATRFSHDRYVTEFDAWIESLGARAAPRTGLAR